MTGWNYGLGKFEGRIVLGELIIVGKNESWGHPISWVELLKHPIMVLKDLFSQWKHIGFLLPYDKLVKNMKKHFNKIIKNLESTKPKHL